MSFKPEVFGKYYLVDKIAVGGMAEIFKAKTYSHGGFENLVVIKRILSHLSDSQDFVDMFIDEAKVSVALQNANIVRIYDFGKIGDNYFIAMECLNGKDTRNVLRKLAKKRKFLPIEYAIYIALEACKGLAHAHEKKDLKGRPYGIVHRDVSPSNVLLSYEGEIKVADFGIAKAESNSYNTQSGILKGKFEYMSPEQASGKNIDHRSDLFSLGIILHEMLTGRRLFKSKSDVTTLQRIRNATVTPPSQVNARVPEALDHIVMKALTQKSEDRYQSAAEMAEDLQEYLFPANPEQLRKDLARFMEDLFAEEISDELRRLEVGSKIAQKLHADAPEYIEGWEGATNSTLGPAGSIHTVWTYGPLLLSALALLLVPIAIFSAVGGVYLVTQDTTAPPEVVVEDAGPTTGSLLVTVSPEAKIFIDGELAIESGTLKLSSLSPGPYSLKFEKEGYETLTDVIQIVAGDDLVVQKTLVEKKTVRSTTTASVAPRTAPTTAPAPTPAPEPAGGAPGKLTVALVGGGWAHVYVDGKKLDQTAPLSGFELDTGAHEIRVVNEDLGISHSEKVTVGSGETIKVRARPL